MIATRSSHYLLRFDKIDRDNLLQPEALRKFDDFVEFARDSKDDLQCNNPPCTVEHEKIFSLTYLLMKESARQSYLMKALDWYIKSNKESIIDSHIEDQPAIKRDLRTVNVNAVREVASRISDEHPTTRLYIKKSLAPLQTFIDIITALSLST